MVRFAWSYSSRRAARRAAARRKRARARWSRKPLSVKNRIGLRRLQKLVPRPMNKVYPFWVHDDPVVSVSDATNAAMTRPHVVSHISPFGQRDTYWGAGNNLGYDAIGHEEFHWPPFLYTAAAKHPCSETGGPGSVGTQHPARIDQVNTTLQPGASDADTLNLDLNGTSLGHRLKYFDVDGFISLAHIFGDADPTVAEISAKLTPHRSDIRLYNGTDRFAFRVMFVQQFKKTSAEPNLRITDVLADPFHQLYWDSTASPNHVVAGNGTGRAPDHNFFSTRYRSRQQAMSNSFLDTDNTEMVSPDVAATSGEDDKVNPGGRNFVVLNDYCVQFSATEIHGRRLLRIPIRKRFYPKVSYMKYDDDVQLALDGGDRQKCLNPCFLWLIPSVRPSGNSAGGPLLDNGLPTDTNGQPAFLFDGSIKAIWRDV